jgi:hypothetical protein
MEDSGRYKFTQLTGGRNEYCVGIERFVLFTSEALCAGDQELTPNEKRAISRCFVVRKTGNYQLIELCHNERRSYMKVK